MSKVTLTEIPQIEPGIRRGRNVHEGYVRACNLQFDNLLTRLRADSLYMRCLELAQGRTLVTEEKLPNLYLLLRYYLPSIGIGNIVEFGTYRGGSALFLAALAQELLPDCRVFGFDSFAGMPSTEREIDLHQAGDFRDADLLELTGFPASAGLQNIEFVPGLFENSFPDAAARIGKIALCHVDCDIRSAVAYYDASKRHMLPGGYWVFDDPLVASCTGAMEAVRSSSSSAMGCSRNRLIHTWSSGQDSLQKASLLWLLAWATSLPRCGPRGPGVSRPLRFIVDSLRK